MAALIQKESSGNPKSYRSNPALANDTSWGLTQPTPLALQEIGYFSPGQTKPTPAQEAELYDPEKNIDLSTQYLNKRVLNGFKYTGDPMKDATAIYKKYNGAVDPNDPRLKAFQKIYAKTKSIY
jgi:soluble lytic murein transglycosylase-like protein